RNIAAIRFDLGTTITTDQVNDEDPTQGTSPAKQALVTIDSGPPTSTVAALPATSPTSFTVSWSGTDEAGGSGIATYAIYDSDNGGPYQLFQSSATAGSATFTGQNGHTYRFYSVATDNVGNVQATPTQAQATTFVPNADTVAVSSSQPNGIVYGQSATI